MICVVLYCIAVFTLLVLYYFYKPIQEQLQQQQQQQQQQINSPLNLNNTSLSSNTATTTTTTTTNTQQLNNLTTSSTTDTSINNNNDYFNTNSSDQQSFQQLSTPNDDDQQQQLQQDSIISSLRAKKYSDCYTYTNYLISNKQQAPLCPKKVTLLTDKPIIYQFLVNVCNKDTIYKYLGLNVSTFSRKNTIKSKSIITNTNITNNIPTQIINDSFKTFDDLVNELSILNLTNINVVVGIDFTASNEWKGRKTFNSQSLHKTLANNKIYNPYQKIISTLAFALQKFSVQIYAYGFGDSLTKDESVFGLNETLNGCEVAFKSFDELLIKYNKIVKDVNLSGPTSYQPIINKSLELVKSKSSVFHLLFILTDGKLSTTERELDTFKLIENATNYPLSIVMIGVGDGDFGAMYKFDDRLMTNRKFDNYRFVDYSKTIRNCKTPEQVLALKALMKVPEQLKYMKKLGYLQ